MGGVLYLLLPLAQLLTFLLLWCLVGILGGLNDRNYKGSKAFLPLKSSSVAAVQ